MAIHELVSNVARQGGKLVEGIKEAYVKVQKLNRAGQLGKDYYRRWGAGEIHYEEMKGKIKKIAEDEKLDEGKIWQAFDHLHNPTDGF